jgi:hypothetical protein
LGFDFRGGANLEDLKSKSAIREPLRSDSRGRWLRARSYAVRKPKEYRAMEPGDLVQVDTLDVRPLAGLFWKHLTAMFSHNFGRRSNL